MRGSRHHKQAESTVSPQTDVDDSLAGQSQQYPVALLDLLALTSLEQALPELVDARHDGDTQAAIGLWRW